MSQAILKEHIFVLSPLFDGDGRFFEVPLNGV